MARAKKVKQLPVSDKVRDLASLGDGRCNCEVNHETLGWIPFTYDPEDAEEYSLVVRDYIESNKVDVDSLKVCPSVATTTAALAREWRNGELDRVDKIVNKIEDFEIEGDSKVWRKYRVELRNWPESKHFPEVSPVAPDAK